LGIQLYSLRGLFIKNGPTTLDIVKAYGTQEVELASTYKQTPAEFRRELDARGLKPIGMHFPFNRLRDDPEGIRREAKELGIKYVGCAWISHEGTFDAADARNAAAVFNRAGEVMAADGMKVFYHNHGYEFAPGAAGEGTTAMDILMQETNPKYVCFQMDVLWTIHPGQSPEAWLAKYPGRWELMHLKDYRKGLPTGIHTGKADPNDDVALGSGQVNWPVVLAAAEKYGVKHYFIEDESADAEHQIVKSLRYLEQVRW
jgi:sugar phosphate isomerase/epimerase